MNEEQNKIPIERLKPHCKLIMLRENNSLVSEDSELNDNLKLLNIDIRLCGIKEAIVINNKNEIIDGYSRYSIAKEAGLKFIPTRILHFKNESEELEYLYKVNLARRNVSIHEKALSFAGLSNILTKRESESDSKRRKIEVENKLEYAARILGVKPTTMKTYRAYQKAYAQNPTISQYGVEKAVQAHRTTKQLGNDEIKRGEVTNYLLKKKLIGKNKQEDLKKIIADNKNSTSKGIIQAIKKITRTSKSKTENKEPQIKQIESMLKKIEKITGRIDINTLDTQGKKRCFDIIKTSLEIIEDITTRLKTIQQNLNLERLQ